MSSATHLPAGSILVADNDSYWYCCGSWTFRGINNALPSILAYVPESPQFPRRTQQKFLNVGGKRLLKVFGQPFHLYRMYYSAMSDLFEGPTFGKIAFLSMDRVVDIRNPRYFAKQYILQQPEGKILLELCEYLDIAVDDIGVGGSSLMFGKPIRRDEIDIAIYGKQASYKAFERIEQAYETRLFIRSPYRYFPFCFKGIWFDPHFSEGIGETNILDGASVKLIGRVSNVEITVSNAKEGIFYPSIYKTNSDKRLISLRAGHVGLFKNEQKISFESLSLIEVEWGSTEREELYAVLEDEWGQIEH